MRVIANTSPSTKTSGYLFALMTVMIWAGWIIVTRLGVNTHLEPLDITFLRFSTAGIIMSPFAFLKRKEILSCKKYLLLLMLLGAGAPYILLSAYAFKHAEASHGILIPGSMPLWVALLSYIIIKEKFSLTRKIGYFVIAVGMIYKMFLSYENANILKIYMDAYFISAAIIWSIYTLANKQSSLSPLAASSWVTTGSFIFLIPVYFLYQYFFPHPVEIHSALLQISYQGFFTGVLSLITYNLAISKIGASASSAFAALVPAMVTILAVIFLKEYPSKGDLVFVGLMSSGVFLASGFIQKKQS